MTTLKWRLIKNTLFKSLIMTLCAILFIPLFAIIYMIIKNGLPVITLSFFTETTKPMGEINSGVLNAIIGSLMLVIIACISAIPFGIAIGVYLSENPKGLFSETIKICTDLLQGTPSIVIGIIAYLWIVKPLGHFSALSGGIALSFMMLPTIIKSTEETLKRIPQTLKEASLALGAPYYRTILQVIIPSGFQGILTGILLGIARVAGESAPLLFTAFGNPFISFNIDKPVNALPLLIFNYATSPYEDWQAYAWGSSLVLLVFVLSLSILAKAVTKK